MQEHHAENLEVQKMTSTTASTDDKDSRETLCTPMEVLTARKASSKRKILVKQIKFRKNQGSSYTEEIQCIMNISWAFGLWRLNNLA